MHWKMASFVSGKRLHWANDETQSQPRVRAAWFHLGGGGVAEPERGFNKSQSAQGKEQKRPAAAASLVMKLFA
jgi:hypothetical protein